MDKLGNHFDYYESAVNDMGDFLPKQAVTLYGHLVQIRLGHNQGIQDHQMEMIMYILIDFRLQQVVKL